MKNVPLLAFSTLACPQWNLEQIIDAAVKYGYGGIEWRGYLSDIELPVAQPFTPGERATTRQRLADAGLTSVCVSASVTVASGNTDIVRAYAELARELGCPIVRVFGGHKAEGETGIERFAENLRRFGNAAEAEGAAVVLETHDAFSTGATVAELLSLTNHPAVYALWDVNHPFVQGESVEETYGYIGPFTRYVHIKDSRDKKYTLLGEGDIPVFPALDLLLDGGYTGAVSVEWEKRWHPDLPNADIVLPQYANAVHAYLAKG